MMRKEYVYFIRDPSTGLIKIGQSHHPEVRKGQVGSRINARLEILCTIPQPVPLEKLLHYKFEHIKHHGEWFRPEPELMEMIETYTGRPDLQERPSAVVTFIANRAPISTLFMGLVYCMGGAFLAGEIATLEHPVLNFSTVGSFALVWAMGLVTIAAYAILATSNTNGHGVEIEERNR